MALDPAFTRYLASAGAASAGRLVSIALSLVLATVLARELGLARYGTWSFFCAFIGYGGLFDLGLGIAVERFVAAVAPHDRGAAMAEAAGAGLLLILTFSIALQVALGLVPLRRLGMLGEPEVVWSCLRVFPLCLFFSNTSLIAGGLLSGLGRLGRLNVVRSVASMVSTALLVALTLAGVTRLDLLLVVYALGPLASAVVAWLAAVRLAGSPLRRPLAWRGKVASQLLSVGGGIQAANIANQVGELMLKVLLGARFGSAYIGVYDLASRAAIALRSSVSGLMVALVPFGAAEYRSRGGAGLARLHRLAFRSTATLMISGTLVLLALSGPLLHFWLGDLQQGGEVLTLFRILLPVHAVMALAAPMQMVARALARTLPEAVVYAGGNAAGLAAVLVAATPVGGAAAYAALVAGSATLLSCWLSRTLFRLERYVGA